MEVKKIEYLIGIKFILQKFYNVLKKIFLSRMYYLVTKYFNQNKEFTIVLLNYIVNIDKYDNLCLYHQTLKYIFFE
jgi:hypothetical protein